MRALLLAGVGAVLWASAARATYTVNFAQVGSSVVAIGSGTIDLSGLSQAGSSTFGPQVTPSTGMVGLGLRADVDFYSGFSGPPSFGTGGTTVPSSSTGDMVAIDAGNGFLVVPSGFASGGALSSSDTFANATFATLGLTPGTYTYTWNMPQEIDDSFVVIIPAVPSTVPEPASLALLAMPLAIAALRRRTAVAAPRMV